MAQEGKPDLSDSDATRLYDDAYLRAVAGGPAYLPARAQGRGVPDGAGPRPGQVLAGKYRVERVLGAGGMGIVVAARNIQLDAPVALKFMTDEGLADHALVHRFLREARATARLRGEHVVRVSDVGELESGAPYMVMEHLQGQDLGALLASLGPPPVSSAVEYAIQACEGLEEAHRAGIVHRDIKPSNLFLTRRPNGTPCIKILDFGISKSVTMLQASEFLHSTSDHAVFGTPLYMAPEQMRAARDVDGRADLWSLGASLYELLSGAAPFPAESIVALAYRIANEAPPPLRGRRPEIPEGLERAVLRCLARERDLRFPDARSLALELAPYRAQGASESLRESSEDEAMTVIEVPAIEPPSPLAIESLGTSSVSWGRSQRPPAYSSRRRLTAYGVAAAVVVATAAVVLLRQEPTPEPTAATLVHAATPATARASVALVPLLDTAVRPDEPPTVAVTDLPSVPLRPVFVSPPSPPASASRAPPKDDPDGLMLFGSQGVAAAPLAPDPATANATGGATGARAASAVAVAGSRAPSSALRAAASADARCGPPFSYDELGLKIVKPGCAN